MMGRYIKMFDADGGGLEEGVKSTHGRRESFKMML